MSLIQTRNNIEKILQNYGLRKIQSSLYAGDLDNNERKELCENISDAIRENNSAIVIPICQTCYTKKEVCGHEIKFSEELYKVF